MSNEQSIKDMSIMSDEEFDRLNSIDDLENYKEVEEVEETDPTSDEPELEDSEELDDTIEDEVDESSEDEPSQQESEDQPETEEITLEQVLAPFKANGKTIEVRTAGEARQLMQMGADYTRKMQAIAPYRKYLMTLERKGLLDEKRLNFLMDLESKNPEAIKKLVKDSGIDPWEFDDSAETTYRENNHLVSDEEVRFQSAIDEVKGQDGGVETLQVINSSWDDASKDILWKEPALMEVMHQQRANGVYETIVSEIERKRMLGEIAPDMPLIHAYKLVGDQMYGASPQGQTQQQQTPVAVRRKTPSKGFNDKDGASAASAPRKKITKNQTALDILNLPDDEFEKINSLSDIL